MYWDLNVVYPKSQSLAKELVRTAIELGYDGIAFNNIITNKVTPKDLCSIQPVEVDAKSAGQSSFLRLSHKAVGRGPLYTFSQKTRLTLVLSDQSQIHPITQCVNVLKSYDFVAVVPTDEKMFRAACGTVDCDVISLDLSSKLPFHLKLPPVRQALDRGIVFEVSFSPALRDSEARRLLVHGVASLMRATRGKPDSVIFTSGAANALSLRTPSDSLNLAHMLGVRGANDFSCMTTNAVAVLSKGATRGTVKSVLSFKVKDCTIPKTHNPNHTTTDPNNSTARASAVASESKENKEALVSYTKKECPEFPSSPATPARALKRSLNSSNGGDEEEPAECEKGLSRVIEGGEDFVSLDSSNSSSISKNIFSAGSVVKRAKLGT
jgi:ribonuclease P/MRP protein subunit RPP1